MKKSIYGLVVTNPASAAGIIYFLLKRLGGKASFSRSELDVMNGQDADSMVMISVDESIEEVTIEIANSLKR